MSKDVLGDRKKALEDSFFAKETEKLRRSMLEQETLKLKKEALAEISGIDDDVVLEQLIALDIGVDTLAALTLVPLVEVAWADGTVDENERKAILAAANEAGIKEGSPGAMLLERWLTIEPVRDVLNAWKEYVSALAASMGDAQIQTFKDALLRRSQAVAQASGGVLGIGPKVSKTEQAVLDELERAFNR